MAWQVQVEGDGVRALLAFLKDKLNGEQQEELCKLSADVLTSGELRQCALWLRELREKNDPQTPSLRHFLTQTGGGARVNPRVTTPEEPPSKARVRYLEKRREKLLRLDEEMRYGHLVKNVKTQTASKELQKNLKSVKQHMSIGANMVVSRIVAFVAVYMVARPLTDNETMRIVLGLGGAIGMMFIEMVLFIARAAKYDALEKRQREEREILGSEPQECYRYALGQRAENEFQHVGTASIILVACITWTGYKLQISLIRIIIMRRMARVAPLSIHVAAWTTWLHHHWLLLWHTRHHHNPQHRATTLVLWRALTAASLALFLVIFHEATHILQLLPPLDQALAIVSTVLVILLAARIAASIQRWRLGNSEFLTLVHALQSLVTIACSFLSCLVADSALHVDTQARFLSDLKRLVLAYAVLVVDDCRQRQLNSQELFDQELVALLTDTERAALRASGLDATATSNKPLACVVQMWLRCRVSSAGFAIESSECPLLLPHAVQVMELHHTISSLPLLYENVVLVWRDPPVWSYWTQHSPLGILSFLVFYAMAQIPTMQLRVVVWVFVWGMLLFGLDALAQTIEREQFADKDALETRLIEMQQELQACLRAYFQPLVDGLEALARHDRSLESIGCRGRRRRRGRSQDAPSPHSPHSSTHRPPPSSPADDLTKTTFKELLDLITTDTTTSPTTTTTSPQSTAATTVRSAHNDEERRPLLGERATSTTTTVAPHRGRGLFLAYNTNRIDEETTDDDDDDDGEHDTDLVPV